MRLQNRLRQADLQTIKQALQENESNYLLLLPEIDVNVVTTSALEISNYLEGYNLHTEINFFDPIGKMSCKETSIDLNTVNISNRNVKLSICKDKFTLNDLAADITTSCNVIEKLVNYACMIRDCENGDSLTIDNKSLALRKVKNDPLVEAKKRNEKFEAFEIIHSSDIGELAKILPSQLIAFYEGYDRFDFYGASKMYRLLPRDFVTKLLKCQGTYVPESTFSVEEKKVLGDFLKKGYIKKIVLASIIHYYGLDEKTRRAINNALYNSSKRV